ncbi:PAS domain S-box protein [Roseibium sp. CAU 1637]|uniref:histidine kinase n=1 Tax=Roseibium limicola TaxID=2816037 RepID=A0A939ENH7_9HYPH|nr:ATP-binding protein [Roseibium limicola]MBO0345794.1 PAS domain S-box protein [Roseibium limicola]
MDTHLKTFMEISSLPAVSTLLEDPRAAWVWSADGARILWANAAGARFFSVKDADGLTHLSALAKSPARPHIARIATSGPEDRMTTDRLRFYRGLRVMLLTCQGQRLTLPNGHSAALVICADRSLALTDAPLPAYLDLIAGRNRTAAVLDAAGAVLAQSGDLDLATASFPQSVHASGETGGNDFLVLDGMRHTSLKAAAADTVLILAENTGSGPWLPDIEPGIEIEEETAASLLETDEFTTDDATAQEGPQVEDAQATDEDAALSHAQIEEPASEFEPPVETAGADLPVHPYALSLPAGAESGWGRAQDMEIAEPAEADEKAETEETEDASLALEETKAVEHSSSGKPTAAVDDAGQADTAVAESDEAINDADEPAAEVAAEPAASEVSEMAEPEGFVFQPRRRPIRFAWQMDLEQRFTFMSDEFSEALGPTAGDIVGLTWREVALRFGLDTRGEISRALDRRDTWSGKTVLWPVSGAQLRVPVDMAALPAFDRDRIFEGYRGFGVCRLVDMVEDKNAPLAEEPAALPSSDDDYDADSLNAEKETGVTDEGLTSDGSIPAHAASTATGALLTSEANAADAADASDTPDATALSEQSDALIEEQAEEEPELASDTASDASADAQFTEDEQPTEETEPVSPFTATETPPFDLTPIKHQREPNGGGLALGARASALISGLAARAGGYFTPEMTDTASGRTTASVRHTEQPKAETAADTPSDDIKTEAPTAESSESVLLTPTETPEESTVDAQTDTLSLETEMDAASLPISDEVTESTAVLGAPQDDDAIADAPSEPAEETDLLANAGDDHSSNASQIGFSEREDVAEVSSDETPSDETPADETVPEEAPEPSAEDEQPSLEQDDANPLLSLHEAEIDAEEGVLTGIQGKQALNPKDIETAVASLAKSYKSGTPVKTSTEDDVTAVPVQTSRDLFTPKSTDVPAAENDDLPSAIETSAQTEDDTPASESISSQTENEAKDGDDDVSGADEESFRSETTDYLAADLAEEFNEDLLTLDDEERSTPRSAGPQLDDTSSDVPVKPTTETEGTTEEAEVAVPASNVVPMPRRRAHLVPVDTSRLSKPEIAAFRKIAEALGARLEDDLVEDEPPLDPELAAKVERDTTPPSAGPIDPRLLDRLPIGIAIVRDRDVLYANDTLLGLLGYTGLQALTEAGGLEAVFADDDDDFPDTELEGTIDGTLKVRLAEGGSRKVDARMHTVPWNGGQGLMISIMERAAETVPVRAASQTAVLTDFPSPAFAARTEQETLESELSKARERVDELDAILETATDGVLVMDRYGTILKSNRSAEALFSTSRGDIVGEALTSFLAPESHRSALDYLDGLSRNGVASLLNDGREVLGQVTSGGLIPLFMTIGRVTGSGDQTKFCAVLRDITNWKKAEEELTEAKRQAENASSQKSDFLAKISHEIRTPLNAIIGFSEVMIEERFGPIGGERYKEYLKDVRTSGAHILSLINDLLDLSKIEAGKMDLQFSAVSSNEVIRECVALMQPQANRDRVIIRASLPDAVPNVVADPRSLRQITLNLLSNAIKFNKSGGQVIISTALEDNGEVVLRVRDTGPGMSERDLSAAMEPFRQLHTSRLGGGTGLGLPLTKALTEANRANFHIDSTPKQGTLVEIRFPSQRVLAE